MLLIDDIKEELAVSQLSDREMRIVGHYHELLTKWEGRNYAWIFDRCIGDIIGLNRLHPEKQLRTLQDYKQNREAR